MQCVLSGERANFIAKAIQSLGKIGSELFVEADKQNLQFRSLNANHSATGCFKFKRTFFEEYNIENDEDNYQCLCRINVKACMGVFRNMRNVEKCFININPDECKLKVQLICRLDTVKNAIISIVENAHLNTSISLKKTSNLIFGACKVFREISQNFNTTEEEITLEVRKDSLTIKNYIEGSRVAEKYMRSQLQLMPVEFEIYDIKQETDVTFCLKEFRAFLYFAENFKARLSLHFDEPGKPVFIGIKYKELECQMILSTLESGDVSIHERCLEHELSDVDLITAANSIDDMRQYNNISTRKRKKDNNNDEEKNRTKKSLSRRLADQTTLSNTESLFNFNTSIHQNTIHSNTSQITNNKVVNNLNPTSVSSSAEPIPINNGENIDTVNNMPNICNEINVTFYDTEETQMSGQKSTNNTNNSNYITESPENYNNKKVRAIFSRCFESTYIPNEPTPDTQCYVPDSDEEN